MKCVERLLGSVIVSCHVDDPVCTQWKLLERLAWAPNALKVSCGPVHAQAHQPHYTNLVQALHSCPTSPTASPLRYAEQLEVGCLDRRALRNDLTGKTSLRRLTMTDPATTKLSSKGQVVIPEEIRERLGLKPGAQFVVVGDRDVVILKVIHQPD